MMRRLLLCATLVLPSSAVLRVVDGDTFAVHTFAIGYNRWPEERIRVLGVDAYEIRGGTDSTKVLAYIGRDSTAAWLARGSFTVHYCARDSFGRPLAWIYRDADSLHVHLITLGLGTRTGG